MINLAEGRNVFYGLSSLYAPQNYLFSLNLIMGYIIATLFNKVRICGDMRRKNNT